MTIAKRRVLFSIVILVASCWWILGAGREAQVQAPRTLPFQGRLLGSNGKAFQPGPTGTARLIFALYDSPTGGRASWDSGPLHVTVRQGGFITVRLGVEGKPFANDLRFSAPFYLGVHVDTTGQSALEASPELLPRIACDASLFADDARNSQLVQGVDVVSQIQTLEDHIAELQKVLDALDARFVGENQANSISSAMVVDGAITGRHIAGDLTVTSAKTTAGVDVGGRLLLRGQPFSYSGRVDAWANPVIDVPYGTVDDWNVIVTVEEAGYLEAPQNEVDNALLYFKCIPVPLNATQWRIERRHRTKVANCAGDCFLDGSPSVRYLMVAKY